MELWRVESYTYIYAFVELYVDIHRLGSCITSKWESFGSGTPCRSKWWNTSCSKAVLSGEDLGPDENALTIRQRCGSRP